jgi:nicotinamide mononucleotide transporter
VNAFCAWLVAHGSTCLEFSAVLVGIVSVFLSVRQNIWSWPTALVNVALFSVVFYQSGLYSDMGLQVVYFGLSLYGWYEWLYGGVGHTELKVSRTSPRTWLVLSTIGVAFWAVDGSLTSRLPGVAVPYIDAATATTSLVAQYMMTRKLLENWIVWIVVDVAYVALFVWRGLYLTAVNYAVYLALAVLGYLAWKHSLNAAE